MDFWAAYEVLYLNCTSCAVVYPTHVHVVIIMYTGIPVIKLAMGLNTYDYFIMDCTAGMKCYVKINSIIVIIPHTSRTLVHIVSLSLLPLLPTETSEQGV